MPADQDRPYHPPAGSGELLARADALLPRLRAMADDIDAARRLPPAAADLLENAGFFHLMTGRERGGLEADPLTAARIIESLATASPSAAWVAMILSASAWWTERMLPESSLQAIFPGGGAKPPNIAGTLVPHGRAIRAPGGWRLTGQWPFASGIHQTQWLATGSWLYAEEKGETVPVRDDSGAPQWRAFHTPAANCAILDTWRTSGLQGTGSHDYIMENVFVADEFVKRHSLQEPPARPGPQYAYAAFAVPLLSAVALGAARGALDALLELFAAKTDRRTGRPAAAAPDKQADLGAAFAIAGAARAYLFDAVAQVWQCIRTGQPLPHRLRAELRLACTHAVTASVAAADRAHLAAGATSLYTESPLDRYFRDAHAVAAHAFVRQTTLADGGLLLMGQEPAFAVF